MLQADSLLGLEEGEMARNLRADLIAPAIIEVLVIGRIVDSTRDFMVLSGSRPPILLWLCKGVIIWATDWSS